MFLSQSLLEWGAADNEAGRHRLAKDSSSVAIFLEYSSSDDRGSQAVTLVYSAENPQRHKEVTILQIYKKLTYTSSK